LEKIVIKKDALRKIRNGHLWIFSNELTTVPKLLSGSIVEVYDSTGVKYGKGIYNPNSLIAIRLLKTMDEINTEFFVKRIIAAKQFRETHLPELNNFRLVFGESDYLPGLIIDKFENCFVIQILSAGMELLKNEIIQALLQIYPDTKFIISKANSKLRELEGLDMNNEILFGLDPGIIETSDNGIKLQLSLLDGQKTGYYLDQRFNRHKIREFVKNKSVLDCYTNQGGFALNAAYAGAKSVTAVDISLQAIETAEKNSVNNGFEIDFVNSDVFEFLNHSISQSKKWDVVILDPPAFTKNKRTIPTALAAYSKLNKLGIRLLNDGGYLATASCSHHISEEDFMDAIRKEAGKIGKQLKLIHRGTQPFDHPVLLSMPETSYLKFVIFRVENL
jgi:23S rRNA (cytosine1962-C5)-methyltransferase